MFFFTITDNLHFYVPGALKQGYVVSLLGLDVPYIIRIIKQRNISKKVSYNSIIAFHFIYLYDFLLMRIALNYLYKLCQIYKRFH